MSRNEFVFAKGCGVRLKIEYIPHCGHCGGYSLIGISVVTWTYWDRWFVIISWSRRYVNDGVVLGVRFRAERGWWGRSAMRNLQWNGSVDFEVSFYLIPRFFASQSESEAFSETSLPFTTLHVFTLLFTISYVKNHNFCSHEWSVVVSSYIKS